jgi:hypothetical protein
VGRLLENIHVAGVPVGVVIAADISAIKFILENVAGVLLGLLGGVGVVEVSLVATGDVSNVGHVENLRLEVWIGSWLVGVKES